MTYVILKSFILNVVQKNAAGRYYLALLTFTVFFLFFFAPVIFSSNTFPADGYLADFHSPIELWTNYFFSGYPIFAAPDKQYGYPLRALFTLFPNGVGFNLFILSAYVLASSFTYGYVFSLTKSNFAAYFSGLVFGLSGFMVSHLIHTSMIHAAAWLPLMLWAFSELGRKRSYFWICIACISITMSILAGHPQITVYSLLLLGFYVLFFSQPTNRERLKYYFLSLFVVIIGCGLAAFQLIPLLELMDLSIRQEMTYDIFRTYTLPAEQAAQLFFAFLFGGAKGDSYFGAYNLHELTGYVGILTALLAFIGVVAHRKKNIAIFWCCSVIFSIIIAFGDATPIFRMYFEVPIINLFRAHARIFVIASFGLAVLAGLGVSGLQNNLVSKTVRSWSAYLAAFLMISTLIIALMNENFSHRLTILSAEVIVPLIFLVVSVLVVMLLKSGSFRIRTQAVLAAVLILDLGVTSYFHAWLYDTTENEYLEPSSFHLRYAKDLEKGFQRFAALDGYWSNSLTPDQARLYNIQTIGGYEQLELENYNMLSGVGQSGDVLSEKLTTSNRALDLLSVKYISSNKPIDLQEGRFELIEQMDGIYVYRNHNVLPRVWMVSEGYSVDERNIIEIIETSRLPDGREFDPTNVALIEGVPSFKFIDKDTSSTSKIITLKNSLIDIETKSSVETFLILSDVFYPGWQAFIDGGETEILKTNLSLRGIVLPAGEHKVRLEFHPKSFILGIYVSVLSLLALFVLIIFIHIARIVRHNGPIYNTV